jgi:amidase
VTRQSGTAAAGDGIDDLSLRALVAALRDGSLGAETVTDHFLARIEAVNPALHALVRFAPDAREQAHRLDRARAGGAVPGPLHGLPFTVKDWIEVAGLVCDADQPARRDFVPRRDATAIARLKAAGAIVLGKSKTGSGASELHPACVNPLDPTRTPGASSSGEAALVAAHASPLGIGSDSGGSIRWPAHCCGVTGLKPTHGRIPNTGHFPPINPLQDPRTVIGPLARRCDDLAVVLDILSGPDGLDPAVVTGGMEPHDSRPAGPWRIAWFTGWDGERRGWGEGAGEQAYAVGTDATGRAALATAVAALRDAGHELVEACPPRIEEARAITEAYWARRQSVSLREWRPAPGAFRPHPLQVEDIERSLFAWDRLRRAFLAFMREYDLILCPAAPRVAPLLKDAAVDDYSYTLPYSLTGQPVVCVPAAWSAAGLPASVQLAARHFQERRALAAAAAIELRCGGGPEP